MKRSRRIVCNLLIKLKLKYYAYPTPTSAFCTTIILYTGTWNFCFSFHFVFYLSSDEPTKRCGFKGESWSHTFLVSKAANWNSSPRETIKFKTFLRRKRLFLRHALLEILHSVFQRILALTVYLEGYTPRAHSRYNFLLILALIMIPFSVSLRSPALIWAVRADKWDTTLLPRGEAKGSGSRTRCCKVRPLGVFL